MKKFYKLVSVASADGGFTIELDGKPVKTPSRVSLIAPTEALANAIAAEWSAQGEHIIPDSMPLMQILTTAQDQVSTQREAMTEKLFSYINTDLLCYRADQPDYMKECQEECWNPWLDWFASRYGAALETTTGLGVLTQPSEARKAIIDDIAAMDDKSFTAFQLVASLTGSLVMALAFIHGAASPEQLFDVANVEENYKAKMYNEDKHGAAPLQEKAQKAMRRDLNAARDFLNLVEA